MEVTIWILLLYAQRSTAKCVLLVMWFSRSRVTTDAFYIKNLTQVKGIKNGCPCIVEIRGTQGCALVGDPARAVGECRDVAKAQP